MVSDVRGFLNPVPHVSFVQGAERVDYLRRRREALAGNPLFARTEWIDDADEFARRLPYMAAKRDFSAPIALNWAADGTDVDFGALSRQLIGYGVRNGTTVLFGHEVRNLSRQRDGSWTLTVRNRRTGENRKLDAKFVFVGAGGRGAAVAAEVRHQGSQGLWRLPDRRRFLRSGNPAITGAHRAKVYGLPAPGAPAMTAAHLDARIVNGKPWLLFGPFAGWSPKFLKHGHVSDLPRSVTAGQSGDRARGGRRPAGAGQLSDRPAAAVGGQPGRGVARIRPQRNGFRLGADDGRSTGAGDPAGTSAEAARSSSTPPCWPPPTAASPACSARRRAPRPRCRRCSTCCSAAFPTGTRRGCLRSKTWCRRWGQPCPMSRCCSRSCGRGPPRLCELGGES